MTAKVMFDTNTFHFLDSRNLLQKARANVIAGKIAISITRVQKDELEKHPNATKRQALLNMIEDLQIAVHPPVLVAGSDSKRGYSVGRIGEAICGDLGSLQDIQTGSTATHPIGNAADLITIRAAVDNGMDYLVTDNTGDFRRGVELVRRKENSRLKLITNANFETLFLP